MIAPTQNTPGERMLELWRRTHTLPFGTRLFGILLGRLVPYSGSIAPRVLALEPGFARIELRDRPRLRNHLNSIHAIALANLGELTSGLAMTTVLTAGVKAIVTGIQIDYAKKARGRITAESRVTLPKLKSETEHVVRAEMRDESDAVVAQLAVRWRLRPE